MSKFSINDILNEQSRQIKIGEDVKTAVGASDFSIVDIPIENIEVSASNFYGLRDVEELAASIEQMGLMHNLVVRPKEQTGRYELVSGERRLLALKVLNWQNAPCKIEGAESEAANELRLIHANALNRVLSDHEKTMQASRLKELLQELKDEGYKFKGRMRDIVASLLKVSPAQMGRHESISKHLIPELMTEYEAGKIGISAAYEASRMKPDEQKAAYVHYKQTGKLEKPTPPKTQTEPPAPASEWKEQIERDAQMSAEIEQDFRNEAETPPPNDYNDYVVSEYERLKMEEYTRQDALKAPGASVLVTLENKNGESVAYTGALGAIVAVGTENDSYGGIISAGDGVTGLDYATLAKVVAEQCLEFIDNATDIDVMRAGLASLFTEGLQAVNNMKLYVLDINGIAGEIEGLCILAENEDKARELAKTCASKTIIAINEVDMTKSDIIFASHSCC